MASSFRALSAVVTNVRGREEPRRRLWDLTMSQVHSQVRYSQKGKYTTKTVEISQPYRHHRAGGENEGSSETADGGIGECDHHHS